jgi:hypothetical protein
VSSVGVAGGTIPSFALTTTTATHHKSFSVKFCVATVASGVWMVFEVKAITAHYLSADEAFKMAFGFNLSAVGTGGFWGEDGGNEFFVVFAFSFGEDCFDLFGGHSSILTCGCDFFFGLGLATATGSTLKLTSFFVEPFSALVFSAVAFFGLRSAGEAVGFDWLKVAFVVGVDTAFHTAVVVLVANNNGASLLVVSLLLANRASHRNRNRLSVDSTQK